MKINLEHGVAKKTDRMSYLKNELQNKKIRERFSITVVFVMTVFIVIILLISSVVLYWFAIRKTEKEIQVNCEVIAMQVEDVSDNVKTCLKTITKDINRIYNGESVFGIDEIDSISAVNAIHGAMDYSRLCFPDITALIYADDSQKVVVAGRSQEVAAPSYEELLPLLEQVPKKGLASVRELGVSQFAFLNDNGPAWVFAHRVIDMNTGKNIGYLFALVHMNLMNRYFPEEGDSGYPSEYQLLDAESRVIASKDTNLLLQSAGSEKMLDRIQKDTNFRIWEQGKSCLITSCPVGSQGWKLVNTVGIYELTREIRLLCGIIIAAGVVCMLLGVAVARKLANWISRPIQELTETAQQFRSDNITIRSNIHSKDEVGVLAGVFNEMLDRIEQQLEDIRQGQRQKRKYELALIQAQIKPHFLYNTLDLIYIFCQMKNADGGAKIAKALADYYRVSLSSGREIITIEEETKNISSYLLIQKERYSDRIDFSIDVDSELFHYEIPKMTLQPLVENSIYHGLKSRREKGNIYVRGYMENGLICLVVEDDGVGMTEEMMRFVLMDEEDINGKHFGLSSVHRRIQLYYGAEYGIQIESELNKGTRISIRIPGKGVETW